MNIRKLWKARENYLEAISLCNYLTLSGVSGHLSKMSLGHGLCFHMENFLNEDVENSYGAINNFMELVLRNKSSIYFKYPNWSMDLVGMKIALEKRVELIDLLIEYYG